MLVLTIGGLLALSVMPVGPPPPDPVGYSGNVDGAEVHIGADLEAFEISSGRRPQPDGLPAGVVVVDPRTLPCPHHMEFGEHLGIGTCVGWDGHTAMRFDPTTMPMILDDTGEWVYAALASEPEPVIVTWSDIATLPIQSGSVELQPGGGRHLINVETLARSTATDHQLSATVLGAPVEVRLTPIQWEWDFGGDIPVFTTDTPGGEYPDLTVSGIYTDVAENQTITATITWEGEFRIGDSPNWFPVFGQGTTTAVSEPFETYEYRTYLLPSADYDGPGPDAAP